MHATQGQYAQRGEGCQRKRSAQPEPTTDRTQNISRFIASSHTGGRASAQRKPMCKKKPSTHACTHTHMATPATMLRAYLTLPTEQRRWHPHLTLIARRLCPQSWCVPFRNGTHCTAPGECSRHYCILPHLPKHSSCCHVATAAIAHECTCGPTPKRALTLVQFCPSAPRGAKKNTKGPG